MSPISIASSDFGPAFHWGISTAAYQIEGGYNTDGKGLSIWDVFTRTPGKIATGENGNIACDSYHRYAHDLVVISGLKIPCYRFSISWSRIFPDGTGRINSAGVDYYHNLIDLCLELDIEPWITLYHWDLPQALEAKGGWTNRDMLGWFEEYVTFCIAEYGDRVKRWMVLNEPMGFTGAGYFLGIHAPGKKGLSRFLRAAHHAALCNAEGGRIIRSVRSDCRVGTTFSCSHIEPHSADEADVIAAAKIDALLNRTFVEPLLGLGYPWQQVKILQRIERYMQPGDERKLAFDMDFIGVQNYTREIVRHSYFIPFINAQIVKAEQRAVSLTDMHWEIYPESMSKMLHQLSRYPNMPELIVTENGAAFPDVPVNGAVHDAKRIQYLEQHIAEVLRAKREGVRVAGYFIWTLLDNFEWAEGYRPRFGLVYVDHKTQKRIIKDSARWYRDFLSR